MAVQTNVEAALTHVTDSVKEEGPWAAEVSQKYPF